MRSPVPVLAIVVLAGLGAGCSVLDELGRGSHKPVPGAAATAMTYEAQLALDYLALLDRLVQAGPAEQAEIAEHARRQAQSDPTLANQLRHALVLGLPGHVASDPLEARAALGVLMATPEALLPTERALAMVMLQDINARLALLSENQRLVAEGDREDKERLQALNRRLQAQSVENARLKQELDEALAKLEAVADLERSLAERQGAPKRTQP